MEMRGHDRLGFSLGEYRRRYDAVVEGMRRQGLDALLVRSPESMCTARATWPREPIAHTMVRVPVEGFVG